MKAIDFTIDHEDVLILWGHSQHCYPGYTFEKFRNEIKGVYVNNYLPNRENPLTFSQWVNAQIITIAY
jgi:hypothetical protein